MIFNICVFLLVVVFIYSLAATLLIGKQNRLINLFTQRYNETLAGKQHLEDLLNELNKEIEELK